VFLSFLNEDLARGDSMIVRGRSRDRERMMTEEMTPVNARDKDAADGMRRPYLKPEIAEEEAYETCAILACAQKTRTQPGCRGSVGPS
jgi:hypothetical protein